MKILVCVSKVPDTTSKIAFTDDNTKFNPNNVQYIVNPYDEWYALVRALELKEQAGGTVSVIHVGAAENEPIIRKALAIGADDAVRIDSDSGDAFTIAEHIAMYVREHPYDLILAGRETIDYNGNVVPGILAAMLDWPFVSLTTHLEVQDGKANCVREIPGGKETCSCLLPAVISAQKGMAEQRIPNMRGIMAARTKPIQVVEQSVPEEKTELVRFELPAEKAGCRYIPAENAGELIDLLHNEAKVI